MTYNAISAFLLDDAYRTAEHHKATVYNSFLHHAAVSTVMTSDSDSALTLLAGWRKGIRPVKKLSGGMLAWLLSGARCRFAYGPADATATHYLLLQYIQIGFWPTVLSIAPLAHCVVCLSVWQNGTS